MELTKSGYEVGGVNLLSIAQEFDTPVYVYDADQIVANYHELKNAFKGVDVKLKYACKALTNINVLKLLRNEGSGLDTVSIEEAKLGLHAGFDPSEILFTPNSVSFEEIQEALRDTAWRRKGAAHALRWDKGNGITADNNGANMHC